MDQNIKQDKQTSDEEKFEDASNQEFSEKVVDDLIETTAGFNINDQKEKSDNEKFVDCSSDLGEEDEGADKEEVNTADFIDEEGQKEEEKDLTEAEKLENKLKAEELKKEGNELFKNASYEESAAVYTKALRICPVVDCAAERSILYGNRGAAKAKLELKKAAIDDCTKAIEYNSSYVKALLRRANLYEETDKLDESLEDFKKIIELDPYHNEARSALVRLPPKIEQRNEKMKEEMMGKLKDLGNLILRPFGLSTQNFEMKQDPSSGSYSINFKQNK